MKFQSGIPLTVSGISLTVSGISLTHNPKETRVAYAVQYEDFFYTEISLTVSGIPLTVSGISLTLSGISLTVSGISLMVSGIPLSIRMPCRLVWINGSSYKYRNTRYWKPV